MHGSLKKETGGDLRKWQVFFLIFPGFENIDRKDHLCKCFIAFIGIQDYNVYVVY